MSLVIETDNLTKTFDSRIAVNRLSLQVQAGDVFGFLGQNGAGKSTTIRLLLGLVKPSSGRVSLLGHNLPQHREQALRKVGAIVEAPAFYENLTGLENLKIFSSLTGTVRPPRYREVLRWVHLSGRENDKVRVYSHGMRQRLGLAQALLPQPALLILDEPTDGLDPQGIREIRQLLVELAHQQGLTILLSSHLLHEVERICNRIAIIDQGRLLYQGTVQSLLEHDVQFRIRTDRIEQAFQFLARDLKLPVFRNGKEHLYLKLPEADIAAVNHSLVSQGFQVYEISRHASSLEDIYFRLTT
ncbi:MAG: ABC transporter ATP-binding protein [Acidobacteria bacterium]|nr:ABC transporter ATP-binding protein [Acidobacteriota bacterium]MCI0625996.1 ABC transporter ATP-binding protein [Acidobacteriota bacterium]MCI0719391.1 ABC transporter ATP-binding protein [Acidobacteriota bacterium]